MSKRGKENCYLTAVNHACLHAGDLMDQLTVSNAVRMIADTMK